MDEQKPRTLENAKLDWHFAHILCSNILRILSKNNNHTIPVWVVALLTVALQNGPFFRNIRKLPQHIHVLWLTIRWSTICAASSLASVDVENFSRHINDTADVHLLMVGHQKNNDHERGRSACTAKVENCYYNHDPWPQVHLNGS